MFTMKPMNKHVVIKPIDEANKVGSLFIPGSSSNQYRLGLIEALADCDEAKGLNVGDTVLYDTIGCVAHRVGNQTITTMKVMNIVGVISETVAVIDPSTMEIKRVDVNAIPDGVKVAMEAHGKIGY